MYSGNFPFFFSAALAEEVQTSESCENGVCENDNQVVVLNSKNFEHLTQVSTGATTGDWFIKFYAPWCGHCKRLQPTWEELARKLKDEDAYVNVASVDVTANPEFGRRFDIRGYPTLLFFSKGKMYSYKGARDVTSLYNYATGGFQSQGYNLIPSPATVWGDIVKLTREIHYEGKLLIKEFPNRKPSEQFIVVSLIIFLASVLGILLFILVATIPPSNQTLQKKRKRRESHTSSSMPEEKKHKGLNDVPSESNANKDKDETTETETETDKKDGKEGQDDAVKDGQEKVEATGNEGGDKK